MFYENALMVMASQIGIEPTTYSLGGCRSIQLSYWYPKNQSLYSTGKIGFFKSKSAFFRNRKRIQTEIDLQK